MKQPDKILGDLFKNSMQKIEDDSFTDRIVEKHLSSRPRPASKPFFNFNLIIIGISSVLISAGIVISILTKTVLLENFVFTGQHGLILLLISLIFLVSVWAEDFIYPKNRVTGKT